MLYRLLQDLGKGIIKSRGLLGTCVLGPPVAPTACVTSGKSLPSLSLGFLLYRVRTLISSLATTQ